MSALSAMQEKTQHLENSLSAETRIKLDLFSALGDAKRQLEIAQGRRWHQQWVNHIMWIALWVGLRNGANAFIGRFFSVSSRPDPPEGAGDRRAEAEDSRSYGGHAQPVLLVGRKQPQPRCPTLLLEIHGQQSLLPGPQRLSLPAPQKVTPASYFAKQDLVFYFIFGRSLSFRSIFFSVGKPPLTIFAL